MNINFETLEITDGTHTMQMDISRISDPRYTTVFYKMDPFGTGEVSRKIDRELVPALLERAAAEIFPLFVEFENSKTGSDYDVKLFNELNNVRWSI